MKGSYNYVFSKQSKSLSDDPMDQGKASIGEEVPKLTRAFYVRATINMNGQATKL